MGTGGAIILILFKFHWNAEFFKILILQNIKKKKHEKDKIALKKCMELPELFPKIG
jgi:hypothetical protein